MVPNLEAVQIQTIDFCNRTCHFCPNSKNIRKSGKLMTNKLFISIIEELVNINYRGRISPYLMNEPLLDGRIHSLIKAIRIRLKENIIFINTNGDFINSLADINNLLYSGLDCIQINCYDDLDVYNQKLTELEKLTRNLKDIKIHDQGSLRRLVKRNGKLNIRLKNMTDIFPSFWNRGGNIDFIEPSLKHQKTICEYPFNQMYFNYLGQSVLCCSDYNFEVIMGKIPENTITQIWNGEIYEYYRMNQMNNTIYNLHLCNKCNRISSAL